MVYFYDIPVNEAYCCCDDALMPSESPTTSSVPSEIVSRVRVRITFTVIVKVIFGFLGSKELG